MKKILYLLICLIAFTQVNAATNYQEKETKLYDFEISQIQVNKNTVEVSEDKKLKGKKGLVLKEGIKDKPERSEPDLVIDISGVKPGRYEMSTTAFLNKRGEELQTKAKTKYESLFIKVQIDDQKVTRRVVFVPWQINKQPYRQITGKFELTSNKSLKIWLPEGAILTKVNLKTYVAPAVPAEASNYKPAIIPPASRPRLWVNSQSLPIIKARLEQAENKEVWEKVKAEAQTPFVFKFNPALELPSNYKLEKAAEIKAFYYLMTGDEKVGKEAVQLIKDYVSNVEFGNILDVTRPIGRAIYATSVVYDWCYPLLSEKDKQIYIKNLQRLSDDMEIGWPPFLQSVVNGHGNEAQVCKDLLSMSIAIYDENPEPYQYVSYLILEKLVPMRKFEYQSPRHNQGVNYGSYRFTWDMHAAWLYYRMTGKPVFDDNIKDVGKFWQYMRLPDGEMFRDADQFGAAAPGKPYYWKAPLCMLLSYTYANDPLLKAEYDRQEGVADHPILYLLLNNPELKAEKSTASLPLTIDFGPILGSMVARTGWNMGHNSNDVVAEIKGGGYHFGNHQHSDAGSIQLYYKGLQFGDLGVYRFYGTPYDFNFNKRSIAHSMMLAVDPKEKYNRSEANDGGTKFDLRYPETPEEVQNDPWFNNGKVLSTDFGPSKLTPYYSYFSADLTDAYNKKLERYSRSFCFLNTGKKDIPALIIISDYMKTRDASFKKYWQVNTLETPVLNNEYIVLNNSRANETGKTHINMLLPAKSDQNIEVLSGEKANSVFQHSYTAPEMNVKETNGHRVMISPKTEKHEDEFLTVFQVVAGETQPIPVKHSKTDVSNVVVIDNHVVSMSKTNDFISKEFILEIQQGKKNNVVLAGMKDGKWKISLNKEKNVIGVFDVLKNKNTIYFEGKKGRYIIKPY